MPKSESGLTTFDEDFYNGNDDDDNDDDEDNDDDDDGDHLERGPNDGSGRGASL